MRLEPAAHSITMEDEGYADVEAAFEVAETAACVLAGGHTRVALQFPDELVPHATAVHAALSARLPPSVCCYILADCTFDGSQLDYVAAQHVDAQLLVHYGGAQLDVSGPIPARLVFPRRPLDVAALAAAVVAALDAPAGSEADALGGASHVAVLYQLCYAHAMLALDAALRARAPGRASVARVLRDFGAADEPAAEEGAPAAAPAADEAPPLVLEGFQLRLPAGVPLRACCVLYVGSEDGPLDAIALAHCAGRAGGVGVAPLPELPIALFTPAAQALPDPAAEAPRLRRLLLPTAKRLMRRYYLVQRARDVRTFGLVVGTLSAAHLRPLLAGLAAALRAADRRYYTLLVGKLNPAKLANFPDIGMFVLLGGARAAVCESKGYMAPLISPHELLLALTTPDGQWSGEYLLDFGRLLPHLSAASAGGGEGGEPAGAPAADGAGEEEEGCEGPRLSLLTGRLHLGGAPQAHAGASPEAQCGSRSGGGVVSIAYERTVAHYGREAGGASYLLQRSFQGLDASQGTRAVQDQLPRGRAGVASGYAAEGAAMGAPSSSALLELLAEANALNEPV